MKILILSDTPWANNNSFGNTFSNLFEGMQNIEIANIYCSSGKPQNNIVKKYFQIAEKSLIINLKNKNIPSGIEVFSGDEDAYLFEKNEQSAINFMRKNRMQIFFFMRDIIWKIGRWKSPQLNKFILDFKPDIIYLPIYYSNYLCNIGRYLKEMLNVPMAGHITDDVYTLKQFRLSPLFWIRHFMIRPKVKWLIKRCEFVDTFTDVQKEKYEEIFKVPFIIRRKSAVIKNNPATLNEPIKLVFTGNISSGRWKTLAKLGRAISILNSNGKILKLDIYTLTPVTKRIEKALNIPCAINMKGGVSSSKVCEIQDGADILVHVESFNLRERLAVKMSLSTKIIDYLSRGKCVLAVGPENVASIDFLIKSNVAVVITNKNEIQSSLYHLIEKPQTILEYGEKALEYCKINCNKESLQEKFYKDLEGLIK